MASQKYPLFIFDVAAALKKRYRDFNHYNLKDPLDELLFIICSTKTGEASYRSTFRSLKASFVSEVTYCPQDDGPDSIIPAFGITVRTDRGAVGMGNAMYNSVSNTRHACAWTMRARRVSYSEIYKMRITASLNKKISQAVQTSMRIEGYKPTQSPAIKEQAKALVELLRAQVSVQRK